MDLKNVKIKLIGLLEDNGILIDSEEVDIDLREYSIDSITFISFVLDVEKEFDLTFPDEFLAIDTFKSFNGLINLIYELMPKTP